MSGRESVHVFIACLHLCSYWRSNYQEGKIGISLIGLTPPHWMPVPSQNLDFQRHMLRFFVEKLFEVRDSCSFCLYWWNCWPLLFKQKRVLLKQACSCFTQITPFVLLKCLVSSQECERPFCVFILFRTVLTMVYFVFSFCFFFFDCCYLSFPTYVKWNLHNLSWHLYLITVLKYHHKICIKDSLK